MWRKYTGGVTEKLPPCPECSSEYAYEMGALLVCPECGHEWSPSAEAAAGGGADEGVIRDSVGNVLADGDTVTVVKTLKVKGHPTGIKAGTKVRNIRLNPGGPDGHDIDCKVDGFGAMQLKSSVVKKA
ncbi:alkylphosphonate utilization protein [Streptomyces sp. MUM 203J]|nr:alkylphosphonate utilization protein [Streptomyces sp. MUM 203J]